MAATAHHSSTGPIWDSEAFPLTPLLKCLRVFTLLMIPFPFLEDCVLFVFCLWLCHMAYRIFPNKGSNRCPLHWELRVWTTRLPGKSHTLYHCETLTSSPNGWGSDLFACVFPAFHLAKSFEFSLWLKPEFLTLIFHGRFFWKALSAVRQTKK